MIYCFDLDNTLCSTIGGDYINSSPIKERIEKVNNLYDEGNYIIIETARGSVTKKEWKKFTENQLNGWGLKYHKLRTGVKIYADFYIDDKSISDVIFFNKK